MALDGGQLATDQKKKNDSFILSDVTDNGYSEAAVLALDKRGCPITLSLF